MNSPKKEFWEKWKETEDFDRIEVVKTILYMFRDFDLLSNDSKAGILNSYFEDLEEYLREQEESARRELEAKSKPQEGF